MGDSNPLATFGYVAEQLGKRGIAFIFTRESLGENRISPELKKRFGGVLIANEGFNGKPRSRCWTQAKPTPYRSVRTFLANPDLPRRLQLNAALNPYDNTTFYGYGQPDLAVGYTDYGRIEVSLGRDLTESGTALGVKRDPASGSQPRASASRTRGWSIWLVPRAAAP